MSYHHRNARREATKLLLLAQLPEGWTPMRYAVVDAIFTLKAKRDRFEQPASLKIELDAAQEVGIIENDGPDHLAPGIIVQRTTKGGFSRGVRLRFVERTVPISEPPNPF